MALLLGCDNLEKSFGPRAIFRGLSIRFDDDLDGGGGDDKATVDIFDFFTRIDDVRFR